MSTIPVSSHTSLFPFFGSHKFLYCLLIKCRLNSVSLTRNTAKSGVEYPCKRSEVHSPRRQDKFETNLKIKQKHKEQRLGFLELLYKTEVGSGVPKGHMSCA